MKIIKDITEFIFVENDIKEIKESDVIFIPGSSKYQLSELAGELYKQGLSKLLLPAGRYSSKNNKFAVENIKGTSYEGFYETDWEFCREVLIKMECRKSQFLKKMNQLILMKMHYSLKEY